MNVTGSPLPVADPDQTFGGGGGSMKKKEIKKHRIFMNLNFKKVKTLPLCLVGAIAPFTFLKKNRSMYLSKFNHFYTVLLLKILRGHR